jgi:hypothetical protein
MILNGYVLAIDVAGFAETFMECSFTALLGEP